MRPFVADAGHDPDEVLEDERFYNDLIKNGAKVGVHMHTTALCVLQLCCIVGMVCTAPVCCSCVGDRQ